MTVTREIAAKVRVEYETDDAGLRESERKMERTTERAGRKGGRGRGGERREGGVAVGRAVAAGAVGFAMREAVRELGGALTAFTDAATRMSVQATIGRERFAQIRGAERAQEETVAQLGIGGAVATDEQIRLLYEMNLKLGVMSEMGRVRVQAISDPMIAQTAAPEAALALGVAAGVKKFVFR